MATLFAVKEVQGGALNVASWQVEEPTHRINICEVCSFVNVAVALVAPVPIRLPTTSAVNYEIRGISICAAIIVTKCLMLPLLQ